VQGRPGNGPANLSKTAGAEARAKGLIPTQVGPAQTGKRSEFAYRNVRQFGSNLEDPIAAVRLFRGAGF